MCSNFFPDRHYSSLKKHSQNMMGSGLRFSGTPGIPSSPAAICSIESLRVVMVKQIGAAFD
jgi:hypothetical protein